MTRMGRIAGAYLAVVCLLLVGLGAIVAEASAGAITMPDAEARLLCGLAVGSVALACVHAITKPYGRNGNG